MAVLTSTHALFGLNMASGDQFFFDQYDPLAYTPNDYSWLSPDGSDVYVTGTSITRNASDIPISGTITHVYIDIGNSGGFADYEIGGFSGHLPTMINGSDFLSEVFDGNDTLNGSGFDDTLKGIAGDDTLFGYDGHDILLGDYATPGFTDGNDVLYGGAGNDSLYGNGGNDDLQGGTGANHLFGGSGDDNIVSSGSDNVDAGAGNDAVFVSNSIVGDDTFNGGTGLDNFDLSAISNMGREIDLLNERWELFDGSATFSALIGFETVYGGSGDETIRGSNVDNLLVGNNGSDEIYGNDGNDLLFGGTDDSADTIRGGAGNDTIYGEDGNDYLAGDSGKDSIFGQFGDDSLFGNTGDDVLYGGLGNDSMVGNGDNDQFVLQNFFFAADADTIRGGAGTDSLVFDGTGIYNLRNLDLLDLEGLRFLGGTGDFVVTFDADSWNDGFGAHWGPTLTFSATAASHRINIEMDVDDSLDLSPWTAFGYDALHDWFDITGDGSAETFVSSFLRDRVSGNDGDDVFILNGESYAEDTIDGGNDTDTLVVQLSTDMSHANAQILSIERVIFDTTVSAGVRRLTLHADDLDNDQGAGTEISAGLEVIDLDQTRKDVIMVQMENIPALDLSTWTFTDWDGADEDKIEIVGYDISENIVGTTQADHIWGNDGDDTLNGYTGNDTINGGIGADLIIGGYGNDNLYGFDGNDTLTGEIGDDSLNGQNGDDSLDGGQGNDTLLGSGGNDVLLGGFNNDSLSGGEGDDTLFGDHDNDTLNGGAGRDTYLFDPQQHSDDQIIGFENGRDRIVVDFDGWFPTVERNNGNAVLDFGPQTVELLGQNPNMVSSDDIYYEFAEFGKDNIGVVPSIITLQRDYVDPVIFVQTVTSNDAGPVIVRITDIQPGQFTVMLQEPNADDGVHSPEDISYAVFEAGTWELANGARLEVGNFDSSNLSGAGFEQVDFTDSLFDAAPAVLSQVQTNNGADWVMTRQKNASATGVEIVMQEEEALNSGSHAQETIGWLAIETGTHEWNGKQLVAGSTGQTITQDGAFQNFERAFDAGPAPVTLANLSTFVGSDPAIARITATDTTDFYVIANEDTSRDAEITHIAEAVSFLAAEEGMISARRASPVIAEYGVAQVNQNAVSVTLQNDFFNPVVVASTMSDNGPVPVAIRVESITSDSFTFRLQETANEDGVHSFEDVAWMVVEAGSWQLADGTRLEAGTLESALLSTGGTEHVSFSHGGFQTTPTILSQVQTDNGADWVITRQDTSDASGFFVTMQEEEARNAGSHAAEILGWVAFEQAQGTAGNDVYEASRTANTVTDASQEIAFSNTFGSAPVLLTQLSTLNGSDPTSARVTAVDSGTFEVFAQEETSLDVETGHIDETVDFLALSGDGQLIGERYTPAIAEIGTVNMAHTDTVVTFDRVYDNPVVFALPPSDNGPAPAAVRLKSVTSTGFTAFIQEPSNEDAIHSTETVSYMVIEAGNWQLSDGTQLSVGTVDSARLSTAGFEGVVFPNEFDTTPAVFSQVQTNNGTDWVVTRQDSVDTDGFSLTMQEEEANNAGTHATETIGWFAIETGIGSWDGNLFEAMVTDTSVTDAYDTFQFSKGFANTPNLLASLTSFEGADAASLRYRNLTADGVDLRVMEDTSSDAEVVHSAEMASLFAIDGDGLLTGTAWDVM
ncbi:calcium-binding protein [Mesobacterium sp. TK19101]|uniref:Calcium-binding protein n=1 Tax=Mesobacterium hydrothermale TaxID=3111907 RepID=A0ABU6HJP0_9RHOB|nr:calcium-binding protein [Mesobacterium sp. TK19101]MEC3862556.1 calcium-binding protein [Mesobacterium sp. TK19101]